MGTGKFLPMPGSGVVFLNNNIGLLADHRNDTTDPFLRQTIL
jgi:hypothetical protein